MGRNLSTDLSRPKLEVIRPSKLSPLEMMTAVMACVSEFRRLSGIDLLAIAKQYTHCHSSSIEILFKTSNSNHATVYSLCLKKSYELKSLFA